MNGLCGWVAGEFGKGWLYIRKANDVDNKAEAYFCAINWYIPKNVASVSGRSEPLIGETPEDFPDLEGCFMTQAIVASYYCCGRGHGGLLDPLIIKVKIPQSHLQSGQKNEDPNLFRSEKLHPAVQECFITVVFPSFLRSY